MSSIIDHAIRYGLLLSAVLAPMLIAVLWWNAEILLNDFPPAIRKQHGPMSERSKRQRIPVAIVMGIASIGIVIASFSQMRAAGDITFLPAFIHLFVMLFVFNVVDLILIDVPLVMICPPRMILTGTEGMREYKDYWFHVRGFAIGVVMISVASAVIAALAALAF